MKFSNIRCVSTFLILRSKWSDARCKSFEHQELLETGLRIAAERRAHIERTRPIVVSEHLIHHPYRFCRVRAFL